MAPVTFQNSISAVSIVLFPIGCLRAILTLPMTWRMGQKKLQVQE